jgi:hypothetical protein
VNRKIAAGLLPQDVDSCGNPDEGQRPDPATLDS